MFSPSPPSHALARLLAAGLVLGSLRLLTLSQLRRTARRHQRPGRLVQTAAGPIHLLEGGNPQGPPLLLLHGSDGVALDWPLSPLWAQLAPDFRLLAPDRPGHGHTPAQATPSLASNLAAMLALQDALALPQVALLGHSYGAPLALLYAARHPERVSGVLVVGPAAYPHAGLRRTLAYAPLLPGLRQLLLGYLILPVGQLVAQIEGQRAFAPYPVPPLWRELMLTYSRRPSQVLALAFENRTFMQELRDLSPRYADLPVPVGVVVGSADVLTPLALHARPLAAQLPRARLTVVPGGSHQLHWTHPAEVAAAARALLLYPEASGATEPAVPSS